MKFVKIKTSASAEELLSLIKNDEEVNRGVTFDEKVGRPKMKVKERGKRIRITCELTNRPTKDNGFIVGTYFSGKITEKAGAATLSGVILTAPIYHTLLLLLFGYFIYVCIREGGFSPIPPILLVFDFFMFHLEFKKQGIIERYLRRAVKKAENENKS